MSEAAELLATLRDIHEPLPPEATPPLLLLGNLVLVALIILTVLWRRRRLRRQWLRQSLRALDEAGALDPERALHAQAVTLRRVVKLHDGDAIESLQGEAWLARLDRCFDTDWFSRGPGRIYGDELYRPANQRTIEPSLTPAALREQLVPLLRALAR